MTRSKKLSAFQTWAPTYIDLGLSPRRIKPGTKACFDRGWQIPDPDQPPERLKSWIEREGEFGIGLLMGSLLPDGTRLGAFDIDRDEYVSLGRTLLGDPPCGRRGQKGAAFFVRLSGPIRNAGFIVKGVENQDLGKVVDCLFDRALCVIPPTIHPKTGRPYQWIGTPLYELDFADLPLVEG